MSVIFEYLDIFTFNIYAALFCVGVFYIILYHQSLACISVLHRFELGQLQCYIRGKCVADQQLLYSFQSSKICDTMTKKYEPKRIYAYAYSRGPL